MKIFKYLIIICLLLTTSVLSCYAYFENDNILTLNKLNEGACIKIIVEEGDSIWNIAKPYYNGKSDYRDLIYNIKKINELDQYIIYPGQEIIIPL